MAITFFLIFYACYLIILWLYRKWKFFGILKKRGIKGPKPNFFFCSDNELNKNQNPSEVITQWIKTYGNIFGFYSHNKIIIVINDYELIKKLFITNSQIFSDHQDFIIQTYPLDKSLIALKGQRWQTLRRYFSPPFSSKNINNLSPFLEKCINKLSTHLSQKGDEFEIDLIFIAGGYTFDVICNIAFGLDGPVYDNEYGLINTTRKFFHQNIQNIAQFVALFPFLKPLIYNFPKFLPSSKLSNALLDKLIEHIKSYCSDRNLKNNEDFKKHSALLQHFLNLLINKKISKHEFLANILLLMLAGFDTTLISICCTMYHLAKEQDIQDKLRKDINKNGFDSEYLTMVWNEGLRFYTPVPLFLERTCKQSITIDGFHFHKNDNILCPVYNIHHDERYWTDPNKFIPERFSSKLQSSNSAFLPFGMGMRVCLGAKLATYEGKMFIFNLVKNYRISACENTPEKLNFTCPHIIFNFKDKIFLKLKKLTEEKKTL